MSKWECNFELHDKIKPEHIEFFNNHGCIVFRNFISKENCAIFKDEINKIEKKLLDEKKSKVNGTPLKFGNNEDGSLSIQRICFGSTFSPILKDFLNDPRFKELTILTHPYEGRINELEKDGMVINNYVNTTNSSFNQMGWHTDAPRDLFHWQKIMPMLNVGTHLDNCLYETGGLRLIPGTHKQNIFKLLFHKKYFIDNSDDEREIGFDFFEGDLSVHDGRLWHRVKRSTLTGESSRRRVMYIPIITGKVKVKNENSPTPFYLRFQHKVHKNKS